MGILLRILLLSGLLLGMCATTFGQVPTMLVKEGDPIPGGAPTQFVSSINNSAVNHAVGYAFTVNTEDGLSHVWGNANGGPGTIMRTEGTFGSYTQTSYESFFGISDLGYVAYSPSCSDGATTGLDGIWLDDSVIAIEEQPYPHQTGFWWSFGSRPGVTADGNPYWVGGITATQGGSTAGRGMFYGAAATPLLLYGTYVTGLPDPLDDASTVSFDCRMSAFGTHYLAEVQTETGSSTNNNHLVMDGAVLMAGGSPISELTVIPPAAGGVGGETWDNFDYVGVNEDGHYMFTGDTGGDTATDEFIAFDGMITLREGFYLDGQTLSGSIEGAYMNEQGDYAFIWDILDNSAEALYFRDQLLVKEGDMVDINGDLIPDPGTALNNFTGISALTVSDQDPGGLVRIYFTADVEFPPMMNASDEVIVIKDLDAAGLTAAELDELQREGNGSRLELEGGFVITVPAVVSAFLTNFNVKQQGAGVAIDWSIAATEFGEFRLMGCQDDVTWDVDFTMSRQGRFIATDDRAAAGTVTYTLYHRFDGSDWSLLNRHDLVVAPSRLGTRLLGASPNPFNPQTSIEFSVDTPQQLKIWVYDLSGRRLALLANEMFAAGSNAVPWDGRDGYGRAVASGTYLAVMEGDRVTDSTKLLLVR